MDGVYDKETQDRQWSVLSLWRQRTKLLSRVRNLRSCQWKKPSSTT